VPRVPRRPGDERPSPPGGRAAERLRAFLKGRYPEGEGAPDVSAPERDCLDEPAKPSREPDEEDED
jgi:hypothetical protein